MCEVIINILGVQETRGKKIRKSCNKIDLRCAKASVQTSSESWCIECLDFAEYYKNSNNYHFLLLS